MHSPKIWKKILKNIFLARIVPVGNSSAAAFKKKACIPRRCRTTMLRVFREIKYQVLNKCIDKVSFFNINYFLISSFDIRIYCNNIQENVYRWVSPKKFKVASPCHSVKISSLELGRKYSITHAERIVTKFGLTFFAIIVRHLNSVFFVGVRIFSRDGPLNRRMFDNKRL